LDRVKLGCRTLGRGEWPNKLGSTLIR